MKNWWKLFWSPATDIDGPIIHDPVELFVGEPVRSIVNLIIKTRHRFELSQEDEQYRVTYKALDKKTGEAFTVILQSSVYGYECWGGMVWITSEEAKWAVETIQDSLSSKKRRAYRIGAANERNRLINIYKED